MDFLSILLLLILAAIVSIAGCSPSDPLEEFRELKIKGAPPVETVMRLREVLAEDPSSIEANFLLGRALLFSGDAAVNGPHNFVGDGDTRAWPATLENKIKNQISKI